MADSKKILTVAKLEDVVRAIMQKVNDKVTSGDVVPAPNGISFADNVKMEYEQSSNSIVFTVNYGEDGGGNPVVGQLRLRMSESGEFDLVARLNTNEKSIIVPTVETDMLIAGNRQYCFASSRVEARAVANGVHGGGIILTTKNRSFVKSVTTVPVNSTQTVDVFPNQYHVINLRGSADISLSGNYDGSVNEYWIEVNLLNDFSSTTLRTVTFSNDNEDPLFWAGGEPQWSTLSGVRIQIHIMNNMATWSWADTSRLEPDTEESDPEDGR